MIADFLWLHGCVPNTNFSPESGSGTDNKESFNKAPLRPISVSDSSNSNCTRKRIDLIKLTFMRDDVEKVPYTLNDQFGFIAFFEKKRDRLMLKDQYRVKPKDKPPKPPRIQTLLKQAKEYEETLKKLPTFSRADFARGLNISRPRATQILNLLKLAPEIQEYILNMPMVNDKPPITERQLRSIIQIKGHKEQKKMFNRLK